jgi:hypothetical protein
MFKIKYLNLAYLPDIFLGNPITAPIITMAMMTAIEVSTILFLAVLN